MNNIHVFDDFLTTEELDKCEKVLKCPAWTFGQMSNSSHFSTPFWIMMLSDDTFFNTQLLSKIQNKTGKMFTLIRVYANGQTFGQDGTFHTDSLLDDDYTFCIYINKQITHKTVDNIGGEIVFKLPNSNTGSDSPFSRVMIEPIYNRVILFPSNFFHKGLAFNRYSKELRVSIAWKLKLL